MDITKVMRNATPTLVVGNILVFLSVRLLYAFAGVDWLHLLALPSSWSVAIREPWTVFTYMVTQFDLWQLIFNMLWLWWTGSLLSSLKGNSTVICAYLSGGLAGAAAFLLYNLADFSSGPLIGSSCSVLSVMICLAVVAPDMRVNMLLLGRVRLKWIILATLLLYAFGNGLSFPAASVAHLAGAVAGAGLGIICRMHPNRGKKHVSQRDNGLKINGDDELILNGLLDKVRRSGYASLTPVERRMLIEITNRIGK
ncbi:MAG: rhomboid family intramembrane serine protease [Muribaculaceae bacterium]|nr:rhomboid family intramembrane serine protease [Muribaculaceae bacterium]